MISIQVTQQANTLSCVASICANDTFIAIYGVIFTITISLGFYIYSLENNEGKTTLQKSTNIKCIIKNCFGFFALTFLSLPNPIYVTINFISISYILLRLLSAFNEVFKINESTLSRERAILKIKKEIIQEKLIQFENLKRGNELLDKELEKRGVEVTRFLFNENINSYHLVRAQSSGYIEKIDLNILFAPRFALKNEKNTPENYSYYIPRNVSYGAPINFDTVILGIKTSTNKKQEIIDEDSLRSFIVVNNESDNPISYIEAETRKYYPKMISLIKIDDFKSLELKLKEFSSFINLFTIKTDSYTEIIQFVNDDIIFNLQKYAFRQKNLDCIKEVMSFSLGYIYEAIAKKSINTFNIYFGNFRYAFYEALQINKEKEKNDFFDNYFRWLNGIAKYSLRSSLKNNKDYLEFAITFLSGINECLKFAFDSGDIGIFNRTLSFLDDSFSTETYERETSASLDNVILTKKAVIFGFTAWIYKDYSEKKKNKYYSEVLTTLLETLPKNKTPHNNDNADDLNYYLHLYIKTDELLKNKVNFGWANWNLSENKINTITIHDDIKKLLNDRILNIFSINPKQNISIDTDNYNFELSDIKEGNKQRDPLFGKTQDSFISTEKLTKDEFDATKTKFYRVFDEINIQYEAGEREKIINQPLDNEKINTFFEQNLESFKKSRVLYNIQKFTKDNTKKNEGLQYSLSLPKGQFVKESDTLYLGSDEYGERLARSEDNKILELIYKKIEENRIIETKKIEEAISEIKYANAVVLWLNDYISIESTLRNKFVPHWEKIDSRKNNGPYYEGTINGAPVFIIYKFQEQKSYPNSIFIFKSDSFSIQEFEIEKDPELVEKNTSWRKNEENSLSLSVTNLSDLEETRKKIVENWIIKGEESEDNKNTKIEELKTKVMLKICKGLKLDSLSVNEKKVIIFNINK